MTRDRSAANAVASAAAPVVAGLLALLAFAAPSTARACGGFFASEVEVDPSQTIFVSWHQGVETYVFRPHFCGAAADFGVILPVPATLSTQPVLGDAALFDQFASYTAPTTEEVCESEGIGCGGAAMKGVDQSNGGYGADAGMSGVEVVDRGTVGNFDFVILQATDVSQFTDWLDQNGFPHGSSTDTYQFYVTKGWYFVAFKVHADTAAPPVGKKLCGDLGPIQLSFPSDAPVVPARIAGVNTGAGQSPIWRIALIAPDQKRLPSGSVFTAKTYFSGAFTLSDLQTYSALGELAVALDRLTVLDVGFPSAGVTDDITFTDDPQASDFRTVNTVYKKCSGGCSSAGSNAAVNALVAAGLLGVVAGALRRRSRRGAGEG